MTLLGVMLAGALGAAARHLVGGSVVARVGGRFPWGTLTVNVTGSFLAGVISGAALYHSFSGAPRTWLATGFCGAYTTFSTFTFHTIRMVEEGALAGALFNTVASLFACTAAAAAGMLLASAV